MRFRFPERLASDGLLVGPIARLFLLRAQSSDLVSANFGPYEFPESAHGFTERQKKRASKDAR